MKKGINIWSFPEGTRLEEAMKQAAAAGFEGFEPALAETGELGLDATDQQARQIKEMAEHYGLELTSLASGLYWNYSFTSRDASIRNRAREIAARQLELAAQMGVDTILLVPGNMVADRPGANDSLDYEDGYNAALEAMRDLAPVAEKNGVVIGLENVWNKFLLSPLEMRSFVDAVNSPWVGVYFDAGNVIATGYPQHWVKVLGKRIKKVHIKDCREHVGFAGFVDLLAGQVNFPAVVDALKAVGYDDYLIAEMSPQYRYAPDLMVKHTSSAMDRILGRD